MTERAHVGHLTQTGQTEQAVSIRALLAAREPLPVRLHTYAAVVHAAMKVGRAVPARPESPWEHSSGRL